MINKIILSKKMIKLQRCQLSKIKRIIYFKEKKIDKAV